MSARLCSPPASLPGSRGKPAVSISWGPSCACLYNESPTILDSLVGPLFSGNSQTWELEVSGVFLAGCSCSTRGVLPCHAKRNVPKEFITRINLRYA